MKTVIEMAREAGWPDSLVAPVIMSKLIDFAELVRADEREQCAKEAESWDCHLSAAEIRARSNT
jgi:hypothetical protein